MRKTQSNTNTKGYLSYQLETNKNSFLWHCLNLETGYVIVFQKDIALWILLSSEKIMTHFIQKDGYWIIERGIWQDWM